MSEAAGAANPSMNYYNKDFWREENLKYAPAHHRLQKSARIVNKLARGRQCTLLDIGCGPATLMRLVSPDIDYYGIDIAIQEPSPNLLEYDFVRAPIGFAERKFDLVVAQGVFEYIGEHQDEKFAEIASILQPDSTFLVSYVNFGHHAKNVYWPYNNVRSYPDFRASLERHFTVRRHFPTAHNWHHGEPTKRLVRAANMHFSLNVPVLSPLLAVEYFFICSRAA